MSGPFRLHAQIEALAQAKKLPDSVTRDAVEAARAAVPALVASWDEATAAFKAANLTEATAKVRALKAKSAEIMASLGLPVPDALNLSERHEPESRAPSPTSR